jgi:hypothetical protein
MFALFQEAVDQPNLAAKGIRLAASIAKRMMQFGGFKAFLDLPAFALLEQDGFLQPIWKRFSSRTLVRSAIWFSGCRPASGSESSDDCRARYAIMPSNITSLFSQVKQ